MGLFERLFKKEPIAQPEPVIGYRLEGDTIVVDSEYTARWIKQYGDKIVAVTKMLEFLKSQYPDVTNFHIRK